MVDRTQLHGERHTRQLGGDRREELRRRLAGATYAEIAASGGGILSTVRETRAAAADGVPAVLLFGIPAHKDEVASAAYDPDAPVQAAVRAIKRDSPHTVVMTDVCLCEYTSHGHCGLVVDGEIVVGRELDSVDLGR